MSRFFKRQPEGGSQQRWYRRWWVWLPSALVVLIIVTMLIWDHEPDQFDVVENAARVAKANDEQVVTGYVTVVTTIEVADRLLNKRGGYLSNDHLSPAVFMDNVPNWERGVVTQLRDMARALRNDISRSQTQSTEDPDLSVADPQFHFDHSSWLFPPTEGEYREGIEALQSYRARLSDPSQGDAQFFARADNLHDWLAMVEKRLGSVSQRLSASVGQERVNIDLSGDAAAVQATPTPGNLQVKTPWYEVDDVFYEARGSCWALLHFLRAAEVDFADVLEDKNARVSMRQIIRELEQTQSDIWSPIILNGSGFGFVTNHSLVMASYVARANAAVIDLRNLLRQG